MRTAVAVGTSDIRAPQVLMRLGPYPRGRGMCFSVPATADGVFPSALIQLV
jgi:hypothetical protein